MHGWVDIRTFDGRLDLDISEGDFEVTCLVTSQNNARSQRVNA